MFLILAIILFSLGICSFLKGEAWKWWPHCIREAIL